jgi:hypothetical protein
VRVHPGRRHQIIVTDKLAYSSTRSPVPSHSRLEDARVWAGLHYRTADEQGRQLGENVADYMADNYFHSVGRP